MALPENEYIVLSEATINKRDGKRPFEILRRWLVQCPQCSEVRLVVGAREDDQYVCKTVVTVSPLQTMIWPNNLAKISKEREEDIDDCLSGSNADCGA